jgi:hypothetical protein
MKTGTDNIYENIVGFPATIWAASITMLPVMWEVNSPLRPRKPMMSVDPAVRLRTNGRARIAGSPSGVADLVKTLFIDVARESAACFNVR